MLGNLTGHKNFWFLYSVRVYLKKSQRNEESFVRMTGRARSAVYTYHEKEDTVASGCRTPNIQLNWDVVKVLACCDSLCSLATNPVITP